MEVGVALSPLPIVAVVLMLVTPRGRVNGVSFPFLSIRSRRTRTPAPTLIFGPDGRALSRASNAALGVRSDSSG
jgi:hypothetical protein